MSCGSPHRSKSRAPPAYGYSGLWSISQILVWLRCAVHHLRNHYVPAPIRVSHNLYGLGYPYRVSGYENGTDRYPITIDPPAYFVSRLPIRLNQHAELEENTR